MAVISNNISMYRGDSYPIELCIKLNGAPYNLLDCNFIMTVNKDKYPSNDENVLFSIIGIIDDPSSGIVKFVPSSENTSTLGLFYYDIQFIDSENYIRTIVKGTILIDQDISK